jgi:tetratricopeptide (TPR) repeat protein
MGGIEMSPDRLFENANFAFDNGHYDHAVDLYLRWFDTAENPHPGDLNLAAWNLFLSRRNLESAIEIARMAYASDSGPGVADTLAQLLYVTGAVEEAVEMERIAASEAEGKSAEDFAAVVARMEAGEEMSDRPEYESYPD